VRGHMLTETGNVGGCPQCDETFFFDSREVVHEPLPEAIAD